MAYPGPVSATQVGSYFVGRYYQILRKQPDLAHQFYTDSSTMIRIDGDSSDTASGLLQIHNLVTSLHFTGIEIKTINSLDSWNGGVLVVVSGCIRSEYFVGKRNYVETFLLAPQDKGFFVLNDIFNFIEDDVTQQHVVPVLSENRVGSQVPASSPHQEMEETVKRGVELCRLNGMITKEWCMSPPSSGSAHNQYDYEAEASEYVDSVHIDGDDRIDSYSNEEQQEQQTQVPETYTAYEDYPTEESSSLQENFVEPVPESQPSVEEPVEERPKLTYASILRAPKGPSAPLVISRPSLTKNAAPSEWQQPETSPLQQIVTEQPSFEAADENPSQEEEVELLKSVYVRNLPSTITAAEIEQEFKTFGKIIPDGVFIRNKKEIGVCYAFVEYDDLQAVYNAIKASPLELAGRQIYVEERRANSTGGAPRGGRTGRGRGRGSYQSDSYRGQYGGRSSGRGGGYQDGGDHKYRGNGFRG